MLHLALPSSVFKPESIELDAAIIVFLKENRKKKRFALKLVSKKKMALHFWVCSEFRWLTVCGENRKEVKKKQRN